MSFFTSQSRTLQLSFIVIVTFMSFFLIAFYLINFRDNHKITIQNTTKNYKINYTQSLTLDQALTDWKVWEKNAVKLKNEEQTHTISKIVIETTNKVNNNYTHRQIKSSTDLSPVTNFSYTINDITKTATIFVFINPNSLKPQYLESLRASLAVGILKTLYENRTHSTPIDGFKDLLQQYINSPDTNPFTISILNT